MTPVAFIPLLILTFLILLVPNRKTLYFMDTSIGPQSCTEEWSVASGWKVKLAYALTLAAITLVAAYLPWLQTIDQDAKWNGYLGVYTCVSMYHVWDCVKIK